MSDDHDDHLKAHAIAGRQFGKSITNYAKHMSGIISAHAIAYRQAMTEEDWHNHNNISEADALAYPNARTAYELQQSPLGKALV